MSPKALDAVAVTALVLCTLAPCAMSKTFLHAPLAVPSRPPLAAARHIEASLHDAAGGVSESSRATAGHSDLSQIERSLTSMWRALPRNVYDRVEARGLRYLVHRYFMRTSGLVIPGVEPTRSRSLNETGADFMDYIESSLGVGQDHHGFTLAEAAVVIATLEQLVFDADERLVAQAYDAEGLNQMAALSRGEFRNVLKTYVVRWVLSEEREGHEDRGKIEHSWDSYWTGLGSLVEGLARGLEFEQQRSLRPHGAGEALASRHSFEDVRRVAGRITRTFMDYSQQECDSVKAELVEMDGDGSGRVPLAEFYAAGARNRRFAESESYLRELGALDETSAWRGPQVIVPNYIQAASNCAIRSKEYLLCCRNECEDVLGELEEALGAPSATPGEILAALGNMTQHADFDFAEGGARRPEAWLRRMTIGGGGGLQTPGALQQMLAEAAEVNGGAVPLHGRLFAQFLHYHFPQECPFPHRAGTTRMTTPREFGVEEGVLQREDMVDRAERPHETAHLDEGEFVDADNQLREEHLFSQAELHGEEYSLSPLARAAPRGSSSSSSRRLFGLLLAASGVVALVAALLLTSDGGLEELRSSVVATLGLDQVRGLGGAAFGDGLLSSRKTRLV